MYRYCLTCRTAIPANEYARHVQRHRSGQSERQGSTRRWRKLRQLILERDGHACQVCGSTEELEVHHLDGNWRNDAPGNLQTRCLDHNPRGRPAG